MVFYEELTIQYVVKISIDLFPFLQDFFRKNIPTDFSGFQEMDLWRWSLGALSFSH